jgi:hypothetical protein
MKVWSAGFAPAVLKSENNCDYLKRSFVLLLLPEKGFVHDAVLE